MKKEAECSICKRKFKELDQNESLYPIEIKGTPGRRWACTKCLSERIPYDEYKKLCALWKEVSSMQIKYGLDRICFKESEK